MKPLSLLLLSFLTFLLSWVLLKFFIAHADRLGMVDTPNERSSHSRPVARGGGTAFVACWILVSLGIWSTISSTLIALYVCAAGIAVLGFIDDRFQLSVRLRLAVHFLLAALFIVVLESEAEVGLLLGAGMTLLIAWSVNIFNFMDGIDGIAGLEGITVLGVLGLLVFEQAGHSPYFSSILLLLAAILGFLVWNWPKAAVFMGDVGSGFLGFVLAGFALSIQVHFGIPLVYFFIMYGLFATDTFITLARRVWGGEKWYQAHKQHAYQQLHHVLGWSHKKILMYYLFWKIGLVMVVWLAFTSKISLNKAVLLSALVCLSYYLGSVYLVWRHKRQGIQGQMSLQNLN